MPEITINWPKWEDLQNESFLSLVDNKSRYLILWGGRGSSKSYFATDIIIHRMLDQKYFRGLLIRKIFRAIRGSMFQALKDRIYQLGLEQMFHIRESLLEIECVNGNKVVAAGLDDVTKVKSVADVTFAWYEEDIPTESDFITVTTSIRTKKGEFLQELFTINPEVEGDYKENWFYQLFFKDRPYTYNGEIEQNIEVNGVVEKVKMSYSLHHSTYRDNKHLPNQFKAFLENLKLTNPYYYEIYTLGNWGNRITGSQCYKAFDRAKHVRRLKYDPDKALHITFDFNVNPYMTLTIWQVDGKKAMQLNEITAKDPKNNTADTCKLFKKLYPNHEGGLFIYGDPSGRNEDTRSEKGRNDFTIIMAELKKYHPERRLHKKAPAVRTRIDWINAVFGVNEGGVSIQINESCKITIQDYQNGKEASDGTKFKEKGKDATTKISYELYHHITDANDYFLTKCFSEEYSIYRTGGIEVNYDDFDNYKRASFSNY